MQNTHSTNMHGFIEGFVVVRRTDRLKNELTVLGITGFYKDDYILLQLDHQNPEWEIAGDYKTV